MTNGLYTLMKKAKRALTGKPQYASGGFTTMQHHAAADGNSIPVRLGDARHGDLIGSATPVLDSTAPGTTTELPSKWAIKLNKLGEAMMPNPSLDYASVYVAPKGSLVAGLDSSPHVTFTRKRDNDESLWTGKPQNHAPRPTVGPPGRSSGSDPRLQVHLSSDDIKRLANSISNVVSAESAERWADGGRLPDRVLADKVGDARRADRLFGTGFAEWSSAPTREIHSGDSHGIPVQAKVNGVLVHGFLDRIEGQKDAIKAMKIVAVPAGVYVDPFREIMSFPGSVNFEEETAIREEDSATLVITGGRYRPDEGTLKAWSAA